MQILFLKPLLEVSLGIKHSYDMIRRYDFNNGTLQKISDSRYEVLDLDSCCDELVQIHHSLGCLPMIIGSEEDCDSFEEAVTRQMSKAQDKDIIWFEPLKQSFTNCAAFVGDILSNRALLRYGKSFQRATQMPKSIVGLSIRDYRLLMELSKFNNDEIQASEKPKNFASVICKMLYTAQYNSFEVILHNHYKDTILFNDKDAWIGCELCGKVSLYCSEEKLIKQLMAVTLDVENPFNNLKVLCRSEDNYSGGYWKTDIGIDRLVTSDNAAFDFISTFKSLNTEVKISIIKEK